MSDLIEPHWSEENKRHKLGTWFFTGLRPASAGILAGIVFVRRLRGGKAETEPFAQEVARRWNAHEELIAALVDLAESAGALASADEEDGDASTTLDAPLKRARAAIAAARGGK